MRNIGDTFKVMRLEKNNFNGEKKQDVFWKRCQATNLRNQQTTIKKREQERLGRQELIEKGEIEET